MADRNWNFTKIHIEEVIILANAGKRKSKGGPVVDVPLSGSAIAVYINLRGRIYATKTGERRFYAYPSQEGIAKDLGWNPKKPKNRVSEAIRELRDAGIIRVFNKEDTSKDAKDIRKMLGCGWSTSVYELLLLRVALEKDESERSDCNRTGVPLQSDPDPTTIGGHSDCNRNKEEEVNNKKKEDYSNINNEEELLENAFRDFMGEGYNRIGTTPTEVYNVSKDRFISVKDIEAQILSDWNWSSLLEEYHLDDLDTILEGMDGKKAVVQQIKRAIIRAKFEL